MNPTQLRIIGVGILFLLIFLTGYWLSRLGRTLGTVPLNIHKFIALADVVLIVATIYWINKSASLQPAVLAGVIVGMVLFAATIVTGGLVSVLATGGFGSIHPSARAMMSLSHKVLPYLTLLSTAAALYLALIPRPA